MPSPAAPPPGATSLPKRRRLAARFGRWPLRWVWGLAFALTFGVWAILGLVGFGFLGGLGNLVLLWICWFWDFFGGLG